MCEIMVCRIENAKKLYVSEHGCGLVLLPSCRSVRVARLSDDEAANRFRVLLDHAGNDQWIINHARQPTIGSVSVDNTQPFVCARFVFAHNGHHGSLGDENESDSRVLWRMIGRLPEPHVVGLLRELGQRYVLYSRDSGVLYLIGRWSKNKGVYDRGYEFSYLAINTSTGEIIDAEKSWWYLKR